MPSWINQTRHIQDGEPVTGGVASRPDRAMEGRTEYLRQRIDEAELGEALKAWDRPLASNVLVGQPVYWDTTQSRFDQALGTVEHDSATGTLSPARSSEVIGLCVNKSSATRGDIALAGAVPVSLANSVEGQAFAGRYYLSNAARGFLVRQRPPVGVPVLFYDGEGTAYILPQLRNPLEDHVHWSIELVCRPAGTHNRPTPEERHRISDADASLRGWLPADHPSFSSRAPLGAVFGYNLAVHDELKQLWPPIPLGSALMVWDRGEGYLGGILPPLGLSGLVLLDEAGIWWLSDAYSDVPWPADFSSSDVHSSSISYSSSLPELPRQETMRLSIHFARLAFATSRTVVTSLKAGAGVAVRDSTGVTASTGDLLVSATGAGTAGLGQEILDLDGRPVSALTKQARKQAASPSQLAISWQRLENVELQELGGSLWLRLAPGAALEGLILVPENSGERTYQLRCRLAVVDAGLAQLRWQIRQWPEASAAPQLLLNTTLELADLFTVIMEPGHYRDFYGAALQAGGGTVLAVQLTRSNSEEDYLYLQSAALVTEG